MAVPPIENIAEAEVHKHSSSKSCYVTIGRKVFDVTDFLEDHPGGEDFILEYAGQDIGKVMKDQLSHEHSDSAYDILDEYLIGLMPSDPLIATATESNKPGEILPLPSTSAGRQEINSLNGPKYQNTGMSSEDDLSVATDLSLDYKTHKFLDLNRPLMMQVWNGGFTKKFYLEQVHRPRHYKGGESAPLFGNFLEPLTKTAWWVVPTIWLPCVAYGIYTASLGLPTYLNVAKYFAVGLGLWTLVEYGLHRMLFHIDGYLPDNRVGITLHFVLHGIHHYLPMDKLRLVMPPTLFIALATPFWYLAHSVIYWNWYGAVATYSGGILGYICYDCTHYFLHHRK
jgi:4-hydroxysphinganine ceramide fatty acyl 2-hydroxylase